MSAEISDSNAQKRFENAWLIAAVLAAAAWLYYLFAVAAFFGTGRDKATLEWLHYVQFHFRYLGFGYVVPTLAAAVFCWLARKQLSPLGVQPALSGLPLFSVGAILFVAAARARFPAATPSPRCGVWENWYSLRPVERAARPPRGSICPNATARALHVHFDGAERSVLRTSLRAQKVPNG